MIKVTIRKDLCSGAAANRTAALNLSRQHKCIKMKRLEELKALNNPLNKSYLGMIYEDIKERRRGGRNI